MHKLYEKRMLSSLECANYARHKWVRIKDLESVYAMFLNDKFQLELFTQVNTGSYRGTNFNVREIVKVALFMNFDHIILFHNHTSDIAEPSEIDKELTAGLVDTYETLGIHFSDHIILTVNDHYSFADNRLMQSA